ncbi:uncharacterized protein LOC118191514 [Stegodyphus dumicola]|uniref:uncharacterized protein LOC118191514 n=1 Tax=Stegodyphus dumicola TaxID=202533 RepID=UPI0015B0C547|nr:uncharacterized protein LOC118191514 [Stegodyphus dumicola]
MAPVLIGGLQKICENLLSKSVNEQVQNVVLVLQRELGNRFTTIDSREDIAQAAFLDPRIKKLGLKCDVAKKIESDIICELSVVAQTTHNLVEDVEEDDEEIDESSVWFEFESKVKDSRTSSAPAADAAIDKAAAEVKRYLQEPILSRKSDPLEWWEKNKNVFPNLYELSRKKLGLVATSVPCERVFSKAGLILNDRRNRADQGIVSFKHIVESSDLLVQNMYRNLFDSQQTKDELSFSWNRVVRALKRPIQTDRRYTDSRMSFR